MRSIPPFLFKSVNLWVCNYEQDFLNKHATGTGDGNLVNL
jgi:hypothetical protein